MQLLGGIRSKTYLSLCIFIKVALDMLSMPLYVNKMRKFSVSKVKGFKQLKRSFQSIEGISCEIGSSIIIIIIIIIVIIIIIIIVSLLFGNMT